MAPPIRCPSIRAEHRTLQPDDIRAFTRLVRPHHLHDLMAIREQLGDTCPVGVGYGSVPDLFRQRRPAEHADTNRLKLRAAIPRREFRPCDPEWPNQYQRCMPG